jgi:hypothetical protein
MRNIFKSEEFRVKSVELILLSTLDSALSTLQPEVA